VRNNVALIRGNVAIYWEIQALCMSSGSRESLVVYGSWQYRGMGWNPISRFSHTDCESPIRGKMY